MRIIFLFLSINLTWKFIAYFRYFYLSILPFVGTDTRKIFKFHELEHMLMLDRKHMYSTFVKRLRATSASRPLMLITWSSSSTQCVAIVSSFVMTSIQPLIGSDKNAVLMKSQSSVERRPSITTKHLSWRINRQHPWIGSCPSIIPRASVSFASRSIKIGWAKIPSFACGVSCKGQAPLTRVLLGNEFSPVMFLRLKDDDYPTLWGAKISPIHAHRSPL